MTNQRIEQMWKVNLARNYEKEPIFNNPKCNLVPTAICLVFETYGRGDEVAPNDDSQLYQVNVLSKETLCIKVDLQLLKYFRGQKVLKKSHCKKLKNFNFLNFRPWKICLDQSQSLLFFFHGNISTTVNPPLKLTKIINLYFFN